MITEFCYHTCPTIYCSLKESVIDCLNQFIFYTFRTVLFLHVHTKQYLEEVVIFQWRADSLLTTSNSFFYHSTNKLVLSIFQLWHLIQCRLNCVWAVLGENAHEQWHIWRSRVGLWISEKEVKNSSNDNAVKYLRLDSSSCSRTRLIMSFLFRSPI